MIRFIVLLMLSGLAVGCSWFGDQDNSEPPAELQSFDQQVRLKTLWSNDTGSGTDKQFVKLVPSVFGDRVFVADRNGSVHAYRLEDGKTLWKSQTKAAISAGTGVGEGLVLTGTSNGQVIALSMDDGQELWRAQVSSEVLAVPRIHDGVVIIQTVDGAVTGLDGENGAQLWVNDRSVPVLTLRGTSTPLVQDGVVLTGFSTGKMTALDARSGRELWDAVVAVPHGRSELQRIVDVDTDAVIRSDVLYATSFQGRLVAVGLADGKVLWNREMSSYAGIAVDPSQVYVSDAGSELWALDRRNGASLWRQDQLRLRSLTGPVVVGAYVGVGDYQGYLHLVSRFDGSIAGRIRVDRSGIQVPPVAIGDRLLVLGAGGELVLYQLESRDS